MNGDQDDQAAAFRRFIPYRVARLQARLNRQATHLLGKHSGLTLTQWRIIVLLHHDNVSMLSEMAEFAGIDKGLLSRNLATLVDRKLVETVRDRSDRRIKRLQLTKSGAALHDRIFPIMLWRHQRLCRDLTDEQAAMVQDIFDILETAAVDENFVPAG